MHWAPMRLKRKSTSSKAELPLHENRDVCPAMRTITLFHLALLSMQEVNSKECLRCKNIGMFAFSCLSFNADLRFLKSAES
jgi:hypothetical protein